jgi:hypothetical protein
MSNDKWKEWNKKKPKDSQYDSKKWSGSDDDYKKAQEGATKPGFFDKLRESFGSKKKKKEEVAVDTCKPKLEKAYLAGELLVSSIYNVYGVDTTSIEEDETTGEQIERTYKVVTPAMAAAIEKFRRDRA